MRGDEYVGCLKNEDVKERCFPMTRKLPASLGYKLTGASDPDPKWLSFKYGQVDVKIYQQPQTLDNRLSFA